MHSVGQEQMLALDQMTYPSISDTQACIGQSENDVGKADRDCLLCIQSQIIMDTKLHTTVPSYLLNGSCISQGKDGTVAAFHA